MISGGYSDNRRPIHSLMMISLLVYAAYALLFLFFFFGQAILRPIFTGKLQMKNVYFWPDLILMILSGAARFGLFMLTKQYLESRQGLSAAVIVVYCVVLLIAPPYLFSPVYSLFSMKIIYALHGSDTVLTYSVISNSMNLIQPISSISTLLAFAACMMAWYRNRYPALEESA